MNYRLLLFGPLLCLLTPLGAVLQIQPEHCDVTVDQSIKCEKQNLPNEVTLDTIFGTQVVSEPILIELLHHPAIERLKEVDQHGPSSYYLKHPTFSRYTHSVGVFVLLRRFGASLNEQVTGLLHDVSHTAFSHLADRLYKTGNEVAYQDHIHEWYLEKSGLACVLKKHGIKSADIMPDECKKIKAPAPSLMGADRIEYNLRTGLVYGRLSQEEISTIINDLRLDGDTWYFTSSISAEKAARQSIYFTEHFWGSAWNTMHHHWLVSALRALVAQDTVSAHDIHFGTDEKILTLLKESKDLHIRDMLKRCHTPYKYYEVVSSAAEYDFIDRPKCRAINPFVQIDGEHKLLTEVNDEFRTAYHNVKQYCANGIKLKFVEDGTASTPLPDIQKNVEALHTAKNSMSTIQQ